MIGWSIWAAYGAGSQVSLIHGATDTGGVLLGVTDLTTGQRIGIPGGAAFPPMVIQVFSGVPLSAIGALVLGGGSMKEQAKQNAANGSVALSALAAWASAEYGVPMEVVAPLLTALGVWARGLVT